MERIEQTIEITKEESEYYKRLLSMTGKKIYDKYGLKRDEVITKTCYFNNDIEVDIQLIICEEGDYPYTQGVLYQWGYEQGFTEPDGDFEGEYWFTLDDKEYVVTVEVEGDE